MEADLQNAYAIAVLGLGLTVAAGLFLWGLMALLLEYSGDSKKVAESQRETLDLHLAAEAASGGDLPAMLPVPQPPTSPHRAQLVLAPAAGVILSIAVNTGDEVLFGQELCILEVAKIKNIIRAARQGQIAEVKVSPGNAVRQGQVLMEYSG